MVVTASLARGAVREAVRMNHVRVDAMWEAQARTPFKAPATRRRFDEWFRNQRRVFDNAALLIVFGKVSRRRGAFSVFVPQFEESGVSWELQIQHIAVEFSPGRLEYFKDERLPVTIAGHALERMFQRTESIQWSVIKDCLAGAVLFLSAGIPGYVAASCRQCAIPAEKGLLVGQVVDGHLNLRTFLQAHNLQPRYRSLLSQLDKFVADNTQAVHTAALTNESEAALELQARLSWAQHKWLQEPYVPGIDAMDGAWESRAI